MKWYTDESLKSIVSNHYHHQLKSIINISSIFWSNIDVILEKFKHVCTIHPHMRNLLKWEVIWSNTMKICCWRAWACMDGQYFNPINQKTIIFPQVLIAQGTYSLIWISFVQDCGKIFQKKCWNKLARSTYLHKTLYSLDLSPKWNEFSSSSRSLLMTE